MELKYWFQMLRPSRLPDIRSRRWLKKNAEIEMAEDGRWYFKGTGQAVADGESYMMVMTAKGEIFIRQGKAWQNFNLHHFAGNRGMPVAAAGHILFQDGYLTWFSNQTGHYGKGFRTPHLNWLQFLTEIRSRGLDPRGIQVSLYLNEIGSQRKMRKSGGFIIDSDLLDRIDAFSSLLDYEH